MVEHISVHGFKYKLTKKMFREYLNKEFPNPDGAGSKGAAGLSGKGRYGATKRPYGDYLYACDREMFDMEYRDWISKHRQGLIS